MIEAASLADLPCREAVPKLALLGTGTVGSAFVARYQRLHRSERSLPRFAWLANSRVLRDCEGGPALALDRAREAGSGTIADTLDEAGVLARGDVVVDATASEEVACRHASWLVRGVHVVTANKLGNGGPGSRAAAIAGARRQGQAHYGDSATVGAGLPLLHSLRTLVAGGDRIHRVEGVLSGSLAWLFGRYDASTPFSVLVREALALGLTEPDPRVDLSGEDVRRKLLILARAAGLERFTREERLAGTARVHSLVPPALAALSPGEALDALPLLDAPLAERFRQACAEGARLGFVGCIDQAGAQVGLRSLGPDHPLCGGAGTDNRVAIFSDRYREQPLLIQGPGAGAEVTAAALMDDVLRITGLPA